MRPMRPPGGAHVSSRVFLSVGAVFFSNLFIVCLFYFSCCVSLCLFVGFESASESK